MSSSLIRSKKARKCHASASTPATTLEPRTRLDRGRIGRKLTLQPRLGLGGRRNSLSLEDIDDVARGDDNNRVVVIAQFLVSLRSEIARSNEDAELAVSKP